MRFLSTVPLLLSLACSAVVSALPVAEALHLGARDAEARSPPKSVAQILAAATSQLQSPLGQLTAMTPATATTPNITPILFNVNSILTAALDQAKLLDGQSANVVMLSADGKSELDAEDEATIVANFLTFIIDDLNILYITVNADLSILGTELNLVGLTLADIVTQLNSLNGLVGELIGDLVPLVSILALGIEDLAFTTLGGVLELL